MTLESLAHIMAVKAKLTQATDKITPIIVGPY